MWNTKNTVLILATPELCSECFDATIQIFICSTLHPDFYVNYRWVRNTKTVNHLSICNQISTETSYTGNQSIYLRSAKIGDSNHMHCKSKNSKMQKLKIFIFNFFSFLFAVFKICQCWDAVLNNIFFVLVEGCI